jgi:hypothetical protein
MNLKLSIGLSALAMIMVGCQTGNKASSITPATAGTAAPVTDLVLSAEAGIEVARPEGAPDLITVANTMGFATRLNPFALLARESSFNREQVAERIISDAGGWTIAFEEPDELPIGEEVRREPAPLWRVSGILIGDTVSALLDTGAATYDLRPGMRVPGTPWTVFSIDEERVVLRREGNVLPREVSVPLGGPLTGSGLPAQGGQPPAGGGFGPGGNPGDNGDFDPRDGGLDK